MAAQRDLDAFDAGVTDPDPPQMNKYRPIKALAPDGAKKVGYIGPCPPRDCWGFVAIRDSHDHYLYELAAYAVSESALRSVRRRDEVGVVFVAESDTGTVYEYSPSALLDGPYVHPRYLEHIDDDQRFVHRTTGNNPDTDAVGPEYVWDDHAPRPFYLPHSDPDVKRMKGGSD